MNKQEFYKNIQKIETAYNKKFSKEELMLWFKEFMTTETICLSIFETEVLIVSQLALELIG